MCKAGLPKPILTNPLLHRGLGTVLLVALVVLSWTGTLEQAAQSNTQATLARALTTYAVARGLNGVISVAQGTELAIQPVGVGVTLTPGEILDPLNDLVERFSWLALLASASLGTQLLMTELLANAWVSAAVTIATAAYLMSLWWPGGAAGRQLLLRVCAGALFARFLFTAVTLVSGWIDAQLLAERQTEGLADLQVTQQHIESVHTAAPPPSSSEAGVLERFNAFLDEQQAALDIEARLARLGERIEAAIEGLVELMVVFFVQTLLIPVAALALAYGCIKTFWRWTRRQQIAVG